MFVKKYEFNDSTAIFELKVDKNSVYITYNSNIHKEYEFTCENVDNFTEKLSNTLKNKESVGKFIHTSVKEGMIVPATNTK
jgi:hypothetical protein